MPPCLEPTLENATNTIVRQAIHISQLEVDNDALRNKLNLYQNGFPNANAFNSADRHGGSTAESLDQRSEIANTSSDVSVDLAQKYVELQQQLSAIKSEHARCAPRLEAMSRKYQQAKDSCQAWKDYLARKRREREACRCQESEPPPSDRLEFSSVHDDLVKTPKALQFSKDTTANDHVNGRPVVISDPTPASSMRTSSHHVTSSQTTVYEPDERIATAHNQDLNSMDDLPEFVSARPVKRKAAGPSVTEPAAQRVKIEEQSTSPNAAIELSSDPLRSLQRTPEQMRLAEMADLDVVGSAIVTPRIDRRARDMTQRAASEEVARPAHLLRTSSTLSDSEALNPDVVPDLVNPRPNGVQSRLAAPTRDSTNALRPLSVNVPTLPRTAVQMANFAKLRRASLEGNVALVSEDGDDRASQNTAALRPQIDHGRRNDLRLDRLLNEHHLDKTPTFLDQRPPDASKESKPAALSSPHLPTPVSTVKRTSPVKRKNAVQHSKMPKEPAPAIRHEDEPLRIRALDTLRLEDFKINPKYMGTEYAWADTLRGKDQRRNMHTCTRPDCCGGALAKAIAIGGISLSGKTDAQALEAYLGPDYENHIAGYGADQKKQITTQAHAYCFAEKHGKHRQAFEKPSTPPGFWDTDFPTTQETAQNRKKALEMEKETIFARWREAMRENGRWKFRDE